MHCCFESNAHSRFATQAPVDSGHSAGAEPRELVAAADVAPVEEKLAHAVSDPRSGTQ
jgi:hypothetical protein